MRLLAAGFFGSGNLGDEAILEALLLQIRELYPTADVTVISGNPMETSSCYKVPSIHKFAFVDIYRKVKSADIVILGGGGLIQDATSRRSLYYYLGLISLAKLYGKKVVLLGQGIGPLKSRGVARISLNGVDLITLRDERSMNELKLLKARPHKIALAADMAFLLKAPAKEVTERLFKIEGIQKCKQRMIGVSLRRPLGAEVPEPKLKELAKMFDGLIREKDCQIVFLAFKLPEDLMLTKKVMGYMEFPSHIVLRQCRPSDMLAMISGLDAVIGMRLHSLIFAAIAGIPAFGISYDPKVEAFQRSVGMPWMRFEDAGGEAFVTAIDKFIADDTLRPIGIDMLAAKAKLNISLLKECIDNKRINILDVDIDNLTIDEAAEQAIGYLDRGKGRLIVTPNPEMIMAAQKDYDLRDIIEKADLAPADGVGLMIAGRILRRPFRQRVAGIDLMERIIKEAKVTGSKIFLFGGAEGVADEAARKIGPVVVGTFHGFSKNDQLVIEAIKRARPDILFVGLGSPRQEKWAARHIKELGIPLVMCVGGSLDVISGRTKRAPAFMRRSGTEWLWRLVTEPRRWRRMAVLPRFLARVIYDIIPIH